MSDNESKELTQAEPEGMPAIAPTDMDMARALVASGFFPTIKSASQALVKIQAGRELGFGPVASMMGIHVIQTRERTSIQLSANMLANLVRRSGTYDFDVLEHDEEHCVIRFLRGGHAIGESRFTMTDAKRAGLAERDVWKAYPKNMLYAAAMRNGAKWFCSEVLLGAPMPLSDSEPEAGSVDVETGEVFEGEAVPVVSAPPEGYKPNWDAFWATAKELGLSREEVHAFWDLPPDEGALKGYAEARSAALGHTLMETVSLMTTGLADIAAAKAEPAPPSDEAGWVPREMAEAERKAAKAPAAPTGRVKPAPETTQDAADIDEARRSFLAAASEKKLTTQATMHEALRFPCGGQGNHTDGDPAACKALMEHRTMLAVDGRGEAGAWWTLECVLRGQELAPWADPEPEPEPEAEPEEAAQAAINE